MPLLARVSTPGKINNTNASTHIVPTLAYLEKIKVSITDRSRVFLPFYLWLPSFCYSIRTLIIFSDGGTSILHHVAQSSLIPLKIL